jgi:hypothetical protein
MRPGQNKSKGAIASCAPPGYNARVLGQLPKRQFSKEPTMDLKALIEQYYDTREHRLMADKYAANLASQEYVLKQQLLQAMQEQELFVAGTTDYQFTRREKERVNVDDWGLFSEFILSQSALDCVQRRVAEAAVFERLHSGILIPGVSIAKYDDLSRPQKVR